ncbi:hypothetical protein HO173_010023 [Letharia columbiana]|uniref:Uncharacterized protein n=1 Tax=Letharia columbiana TaxID=112416 RepID=A0A8H6L175_9LECA|nr:uncharacterized protein HO173_010023 [Letharia columbiana]KAF6231721.1 hypothetical protein HO173_010023 [Letharia columbiana]
MAQHSVEASTSYRVASQVPALSPRPNSLKWTGGYYNRSALWLTEPDTIIIIKSLAVKHLASELLDTLNLDGLEGQIFAQGGFNKAGYTVFWIFYESSALRVSASRTALQGRE